MYSSALGCDPTQQNGAIDCTNGQPSPPQPITIRLIMQGKEVGSIIGKKGDTIKKFRTESGARINISDGSSIERIVTLMGEPDSLHKAFEMISYKFEEDMSEGLTHECPKPPVTLRLIVPASQCGSIIGKGGSKIKEIREHTGCTIQVAGDFLPQSTERAVTISGMPEAITKCIMEICKIMIESPPKGATLPYRPKSSNPIQSPQLPSQTAMLYSPAYALQAGQLPYAPQTTADLAKLQSTFATNIQNPLLSGVHFPGANQELTIPNDLIGCVIGPGGSRINEIRSLSGANIKISNLREGSSHRTVTLSGTHQSLCMARYLIHTSLGIEPTLLATTPHQPAVSSASGQLNPQNWLTGQTAGNGLSASFAGLNTLNATSPSLNSTLFLQYLNLLNSQQQQQRVDLAAAVVSSANAQVSASPIRPSVAALKKARTEAAPY